MKNIAIALTAVLGISTQTMAHAEMNRANSVEQSYVIPTPILRAIEGEDGKMTFVLDNGRHVIVGRMISTWDKKELKTAKDIKESYEHIDFKKFGFSADVANPVVIGKGDKEVIIFVDTHSHWCRRLMEDVKNSQALQKEFKFKFVVVVSVLGDESPRLAKKLYCAKTQDNNERFDALIQGEEAIEALEQAEFCNMVGFNFTNDNKTLMGVHSVPFLVAPDGRFTYGRPSKLMKFLKGE